MEKTSFQEAVFRFKFVSVRVFLASFVVLGAFNFSTVNVAQAASVQPTLPQLWVDTTMPVQSGAIINVANNCTGLSNCYTSIQAAVNAAQPGDTVVVKAGDTFSENVLLPVKSNPNHQWIFIESSKLSSLPAAGVRVSPADAVNMAKIVPPDNSTPAIVADYGSSYYRVMGIEITDNGVSSAYGAPLPSGGTGNWNQGFVNLGGYPNFPDATHPQADHIIMDHDYIHAQPTTTVKYGVRMEGMYMATINSYISEIHGYGYDAQAISGMSGQGPFKIVNNTLSASTENIIFGGADPSITGLIPSDLEIRNNYLFKPLSWNQSDPNYVGIHWAVKNLFELKNAQRVLVDGNVMQNNWADGQTGFAVLFTPVNQGSTCPWCNVSDITFTNNVISNSPNGLQLIGYGANGTALGSRRLLKNNLFEGISGSYYLITMGGQAADQDLEHNTFVEGSSESFIGEDSGTSAPFNGFTFSNNIVSHGPYGIHSPYGTDKSALDMDYPGYTFTGNVLYNYTGGTLPSGNLTSSSDGSSVGFVNYNNGNNGDYHLSSSSPYKGTATDGTDPGANIDQINAETSGVITGGNTNPYTPPVSNPPTTDTTAPVVSLTAPLNGATVSGTTTISATATDNVGVAGVQFQLDGANLGAEVSAAPYQYSWDTTAVTNGSHTLSAIARDAAGNKTTATATVTVSNAVVTTGSVYASPTSADFGPVQVGQTSAPLDFKLYNTTSSQVVSITPATTGDFAIQTNYCNVGAAPNTHCDVYVTFTPTLAGTRTGTLTFTEGGVTQTVTLTGTGSSVSTGTTASVKVVLGSTSLTVGQTTQGTATALDSLGNIISGKTFTWSSSNPAVATVSSTGLVTAVSAGSATITASVDGQSGSQTVTVASVVVTPPPTSDTTAPAVAITNPTANSVVSGNIAIAANATDNVGVVGVQFQLDGANFGAEDVVYPYQISWNTSKYMDGAHTITAIARDAAGNKTTSVPVIVTVNNSIKHTGNKKAASGVAALDLTSIPDQTLIDVTGAPQTNTSPSTQVGSNNTPQTGAQNPANTGSIFTTGSLVNDNGTIYLIRNGVKIPFTNASAFLGLGYKFSNVTTGSTANIPLEPSGYTIHSSTQAHPWGSFLLYNQTAYYSTQAGMIGIPSQSILQSVGANLSNILPANAADIQVILSSHLPAMSIADGRVAK